jgi:hypothetical protein
VTPNRAILASVLPLRFNFCYHLLDFALSSILGAPRGFLYSNSLIVGVLRFYTIYLVNLEVILPGHYD